MKKQKIKNNELNSDLELLDENDKIYDNSEKDESDEELDFENPKFTNFESDLSQYE